MMAQSTRSYLIIIFLVSAIFLVAGCGGNSNEVSTATVTGSVTYDGVRQGNAAVDLIGTGGAYHATTGPGGEDFTIPNVVPGYYHASYKRGTEGPFCEPFSGNTKVGSKTTTVFNIVVPPGPPPPPEERVK